MKTRLTLVLVACLGLVSFPVFGQESPTPSKDPKAMALLTGAMAAMGGPGIAAVADTTAEITIRSASGETVSETPAVLKTLGKKAWRVEGANARNGAATITNGDWIVSRSADGETQEYPTIAVAEAGNWRIPWLSIVADADDPDVEVTYLDSEEGGRVHRIRIFRTLRGSPFAEVAKPCEVFLDAQTGLPIKLTFFAHPPENLRVSIPVTVEYSGYQAASGVLIPTSVKYSIRGQLLTEIVVSQFAINTGASLADFQVR